VPRFYAFRKSWNARLVGLGNSRDSAAIYYQPIRGLLAISRGTKYLPSQSLLSGVPGHIILTRTAKTKSEDQI